MKNEGSILINQVQIDRVRYVGEGIARVVGDDLPAAEWEFVVFQSTDLNAFALPGGKVGIYSGLLNVAETDAEPATMMGHEIAHVTARHGSERMSQNILVVAGAIGVGLATQDGSDGDRAAAMAAYGLDISIGVMLLFSCNDESEADAIDLRYAARPGYDPRGSIDFWERMTLVSKGKKKPAELLSTHPADDTRIRNLKKIMPGFPQHL
jgi:predicted Zn-dependent protease